MTNGYALEMTFDLETEAKIRALWDELAAEGISSYMKRVGATPHVSLAVLDDVDCEILRATVSEFAHSTPPFDIHLCAVGSFPGPTGVVFLAPVVTRRLLEAHAQLHGLLERHGLISWVHYRPEHWVPHCTVAMELAPPDVAAAVSHCRESDTFVHGQLVGLSLVKFQPTRDLCAFPLGQDVAPQIAREGTPL